MAASDQRFALSFVQVSEKARNDVDHGMPSGRLVGYALPLACTPFRVRRLSPVGMSVDMTPYLSLAGRLWMTSGSPMSVQVISRISPVEEVAVSVQK